MFAWYSLLGLLVLLVVAYFSLPEYDDSAWGLLFSPCPLLFFIPAPGQILFYFFVVLLVLPFCMYLLEGKWLSAILTIMPSCAMALCCFLWISMPKVIIVEDNKRHSTKIPFTGSFTTDDGTTYYISSLKCYIYNKSSAEVVIYPISYGAHSDEEPILISSGKFAEGKRIKWYFEDAPNAYEVGWGGETFWVLDYIDDALERLKKYDNS